MNTLKIVFSALVMVLLSFSLQAQSCHGSKSGKSACCAKSGAKSSCASASTASTDQDGTAQVALVGATTEIFKVYGNCGMCKSRIEGALNEVKGIKAANWDTSTKMMTVSFDAKAISVADIQKKIAAVGHDTEGAKAEDIAYNQLHGCCKYDRERS